MENITPADIDICILTYNRAKLVKSAIESILSQTAQGFSLTIFDNASSDATQSVIEKIISENPNKKIGYIRHKENIGADANFHSALDFASAKYVMIFHDDDMLHPRYIQTAVEAINAFKNVALVCSNYSYKKIIVNENYDWENVEKSAFVLNNQQDFAAYIFCDGRASFSSAIYRTCDIKAFNRKNIYGKIGDTPAMIDTAKGGKTVVLADKKMFVYRIHDGQDSKNTSNGPFREEIINRNKLFKEILVNANFCHRFLYFISYAEWFSRHIKFAGANEARKREFLKSLSSSDTGGIMTKLYAIPAIGELLRGIIRILRISRKFIWRAQKF